MDIKYKRIILAGLAPVVFTGCLNTPSKEDLKLKEKKEQALGQQLFFDTILSKNKTQSCSTCHDPAHGFIDSRDNNVSGAASMGDDQKSIGDRNAPSAAYAMFSPHFHYDKKKGQFIGGQFWDGREDHLQGQAGGPPLNPIEMAMTDKKEVVERLKNDPSYTMQFKELYGKDIFNDPKKAFESMAGAIAAFETTKEFAPFDSKYDRYLKGEYDLTPLEDLGRSLFFQQQQYELRFMPSVKARGRLE